MKLLLDTHLLLWAAGQPDRLSPVARALLDDDDNQPLFSAASLWEIAIKHGLGREDFRVEPRLLWRGLLDNGWQELPERNPTDGLASEHPAFACPSPDSPTRSPGVAVRMCSSRPPPGPPNHGPARPMQ